MAIDFKSKGDHFAAVFTTFKRQCRLYFRYPA